MGLGLNARSPPDARGKDRPDAPALLAECLLDPRMHVDLRSAHCFGGFDPFPTLTVPPTRLSNPTVASLRCLLASIPRAALDSPSVSSVTVKHKTQSLLGDISGNVNKAI